MAFQQRPSALRRAFVIGAVAPHTADVSSLVVLVAITNALPGQREPLCAERRSPVWMRLNRALFRRRWREDFTLASRLRFRLGFGCFLYFFAAFVFASHAVQFAMDVCLSQSILHCGRAPAHPACKLDARRSGAIRAPATSSESTRFALLHQGSTLTFH